MSKLLKTKPSLHIEESDFEEVKNPYIPSDTNKTPEYYSTVDFKHEQLHDVLCLNVLNYFKKYPKFKNGIFSNDYIQKICIRIEKECFGKKNIDKKRMVKEIIEKLLDTDIPEEQLKMINNTIDFLHRSNLINVSVLRKVYHTMISFFFR